MQKYTAIMTPSPSSSTTKHKETHSEYSKAAYIDKQMCDTEDTLEADFLHLYHVVLYWFHLYL